MQKKSGFTLIELLVVIAIIAILAAILFPVFARAREKARQTTCTSNQRQIAASIQMYAQDHDEMLPATTTVWSDIKVDPGVLICPTLGKSTPNGYVYYFKCDNLSIGQVADPTSYPLTTDGAAPNNVATLSAHIAYRHSNQAMVSYIDGHVAPTTYIAFSTDMSNLAYTASATGFLPDPGALGQGSSGGIIDGSEFDWFSGATSPRLFSATTMQPYITWSSDQTIRQVRVFEDVTSAYDRVMIDTLKSGGSAANESDWQNQKDTGTGFNSRVYDADLGSAIITRGVRVRVFKSAVDVCVGEVQVFGPQPSNSTLKTGRLTPASITASSTNTTYTTTNQAIDANYGTRWLSATPALNTGTTYTLDITYNSPKLINGISYLFCPQGGYSDMPTQWTLKVNQGSGFQTLDTFTKSGSRLFYFYNFSPAISAQNTTIRLEVPESAVTNGLAVWEFDAFSLDR
ncbi:MAG: prepilin-type N-terminal cleavage/methylation domain-containing protein [bacterium]